MEKDKMIEEVAKALEEIAECGWIDDIKVEELAQKLVALKIYKIPDGAVVLTKEELEKLKCAIDISRWAFEKERLEQARKETVREFAQELIKLFEEQKKRYDMCIDQRQKDLIKLSENEQELREYTIRCEGKENGQWVMADKAIGHINKLLKEKYGIEVE